MPDGRDDFDDGRDLPRLFIEAGTFYIRAVDPSLATIRNPVPGDEARS